MSNAIELKIPSRVDYVQLVRAVVGAVASTSPNLSTARIADLRLVVSEAVTNAIHSQEKISESERLTIRCSLIDNFIEVEVVDKGSGFEIDSVPELPPTDSPERLEHERGLGLSIMRAMSDGLVIDSSSEGTQVRMILTNETS